MAVPYARRMSTDPRFDSLRASGASEAFSSALRKQVESGPENELAAINPFTFATQAGLGEDEAIDGFLRASRVGLVDLTWSVHCPQCRGGIEIHNTSRSIRSDGYYCTACDISPTVTLDSIVEATFTVNPRVRQIAAHHPESLPLRELLSVLFSSRLRPDSLTHLAQSSLAEQDLPPAQTISLTFELAPGKTSIREPVTHSAVTLMAEGERRTEPVHLAFTFPGRSARLPTQTLRPGPVTVSIENPTARKLRVFVHPVNERLREAFHRYQPYLSAKRLFTHPTFRELFRTDALDIDQQLRVESLTILFTDLKGSTELYERVGDLVAFDLVRKHFTVLERAVRANSGSVVKTIGDAVMAAFPSPKEGLNAALQMRDELEAFNRERQHEDVLIKIGLHDGPCLAVMLNERLDYFGQTVNIAARVQGLAEAQSILATPSIIDAGGVSPIIEEAKLRPAARNANLKGIKGEMTLYEMASAPR